MNAHNGIRYTKKSPWWRFIRQEFQLEEIHHTHVGIFGRSHKDESVSLTSGGTLTIRSGFKWGASGPTVDTKSSRRASLVHDALYHLSSCGVFEGDESRKMREISDNLLYKICVEDKMFKYRAKLWLKSLDIFGGFAWESED